VRRLKDVNLCSACREDFASVSGLDDHRIGKHGNLYSGNGRMAVAVSARTR
jgi:hypothetical protein